MTDSVVTSGSHRFVAAYFELAPINQTGQRIMTRMKRNLTRCLVRSGNIAASAPMTHKLSVGIKDRQRGQSANAYLSGLVLPLDLAIANLLLIAKINAEQTPLRCIVGVTESVEQRNQRLAEQLVSINTQQWLSLRGEPQQIHL